MIGACHDERTAGRSDLRIATSLFTIINPSCYLSLSWICIFPRVILQPRSAWIDISKPYPHVHRRCANPLRAHSVDLAYIAPACDISFDRVELKARPTRKDGTCVKYVSRKPLSPTRIILSSDDCNQPEIFVTLKAAKKTLLSPFPRRSGWLRLRRVAP